MNLADVINAANAAQRISARVDQLETAEADTRRNLAAIQKELNERRAALNTAVQDLKAAIDK